MQRPSGVSRHLAVARLHERPYLAPQSLNYHLADESAAVVANVYNERFLFDLRVKVATERDEPLPHHVGNVQIPKLPIGCVGYIPTVRFDPRGM